MRFLRMRVFAEGPCLGPRAFYTLSLLSFPLPPLAAHFVEISATSGVDYRHGPESGFGNRGLYKNQGGAAALDLNADGWTDLIVARADQPPLVFLNQGDGTFALDPVDRGLSIAVDAAAFAAGDFNNNGHLDLLVAPRFGPRYWLFINDGTGHFTEEAELRGADLALPPEWNRPRDQHSGYSIGLVDYDRDGYLDAYLCEWGSRRRSPLHTVLLRNRGAEAPGYFENVTEDLDLVQTAGRAIDSAAFSTAWADFDGDGWPDLAVVSDFLSSRFYWNNGDGTFTDGTVESGLGLDENGMGVAVADFDRDGLLDFFVSSIYDQPSIDNNGNQLGNKLYRNLGHRQFEEVAADLGLDDTGWGWGAVFLDYDNNGTPDLLVTNGYDQYNGDPYAMGLTPDRFPYVTAWDDPTRLFSGDGAGRFNDVTAAAGITDTGFGRGIVVFDFDQDGDEDVFIVVNGGPPVFYRNTAAQQGNAWLRFAFEGTRSNRDGYGTLVRVTTGDVTQTAVYNPTNAFLGQREPFLHFGLGAAIEEADQVEVTWPSGLVQRLGPVASNQVVALLEPSLTFETWLPAHFDDTELADLAVSGPRADPDRDGLDNLTEYALHRDPRRAEGPALVVERIDAETLRVTVARRTGLADVILHFEGSSDLSTWAPVEARSLEVTPAGWETEQLAFSVGADEAPRFFRVRAERVEVP